MYLRNSLSLALLTALAGTCTPWPAEASLLSGARAPTLLAATTGGAAAGGEARYLLLPRGVLHASAPGLALVHDYGAFQLWRTDASAHARLSRDAKALAAAVQGTIDLPGGVFDPVAAPRAPARASAADPVGPAVHVVQFVGPVVDSWLEQIRATGATPIQYVNHNAYLVLANAASASAMRALAARKPTIRFFGQVDAGQKISAAMAQRLAADAQGSVRQHATVVIAAHAAAAVSQRAIDARVSARGEWYDLHGMLALEFDAPAQAIREIAELGDVLVVEPAGDRIPLDEVQTQIVRGHLTPDGSAPAGTGYLGWLTGLGFSTTPADYPIVSIVDDGIGNGTTTAGAGDFRLTRDGDNTTSRVTFAVSCDGGNTATARSGIGGHGHLNATVAVGYDQNTGFPFRDPAGYLRGQGVNPWGRVANIEIFNSGGPAACGAGDAGVIQTQAAQGVKVSSNSWGYINPDNSPVVIYDAAARAYDVGVRDANTVSAGHQPMIVVFAAGNDGPGANSVGSPGNAKNVLTVGASENVRPSDEDGSWADGCGTGPGGANSAMDVIPFSSRGPSVGGRVKPEVIAPGTHVQGSASTAAGYNGTGVCDQFRPSGQTSLAASSGTSHSTPAVAGAASLLYRWLQTEYGLSDPSPALVKSYFMTHPTYLTGFGANDTLPSNTQGFGMPNLESAFDDQLPRLITDQTVVLGASGQTHQVLGAVADPSRPTRIALSWTDAPGAASSATPQVNNLDLEVRLDGVLYRGNVFSGAFGATGGSADTANNYEAVFLPAGATGSIEITVVGTGVNGDGVPGNADATDQDFALVCSNCTQDVTFSVGATPASAAVCAGASPQWTVAVGALNGYSGNVALALNDAPVGASPSFDTNPVAAPGNSTLTVGTAGVAAGDYLMTVVGTQGATTRERPISLGVSTVVPGAFGPSAPANGALGVSVKPTLSWSAASDASSYLLQVATDAGFASIVHSQTLDDTSATLTTALAAATRHYWRVTATNPCGDTVSAASSFFTANQASVLLVDDSHGVGVPANYTAALDAIVGAGNYALRNTETEGEPEAAADLAPYSRIVWFTGGVFAAPGSFVAGPNPTTEAALATKLNGGACFFISGQDYRYDRGATSTFMTEHLGSTVTTQDVTVATVTGENVYTGLGPYTLTYPSGIEPYPDRLGVSAGGLGKQTAMRYSNAGGGSFTMISRNVTTAPAYFTSFAAFPLEAVPAAGRQAILQRFFTTCSYASNAAPVAVNDALAVLPGGTATTLTGGATTVKANDTDAQDGTPGGNVVLLSGVSNGTLTLNAAGTFSYTHDGGPSASDAFTYVVYDSAGAYSNAATVAITIGTPNQAPVAVADSIAVDEGATATTLVGGATSVRSNDTDAEDGTPTGNVVQVAGPANGSLTLAADGTFSYAHNGSETTSDSFTYNVRDSAGAVSNTVTVSISIAAQNDAPVAVADAFTVAEGGTATTLTGGNTSVRQNDTDAESGTPTGNVVQLTDTANGSLTLATDGTFSYVHDGGGSTTDSFTYDVRDASGAVSNAATVSITITPSNDAPVAVADAIAVAEGGTATTLVGGNTSVRQNDTDEEDGTPTGNVNLGTNVVNGTLVLAGNGTFTYTHNGGETTSDSFTYRVRDSTNTPSAFVTVAITVSAVNDVPTAVGTIADRTDAEGAVVSQATAANFAEVDVGDTLAYSATGLPAGLSIDTATGLISGTLSFAAAAGSPFSVEVTATDDASATATQSFAWTVTDVNQAPSAVGTIADRTDAEGVAVVQATAANFSDADIGDTLAYSATGLPAGLAIDPVSGVISGTPAFTANAGSPFNVVVTATDDGNATATQAFIWTITDSNQAPAAVGTIADRTDAEGVAVVQATAANFSEADVGDTLAYSATGLPAGLAIDPVSGVISGTLAFTANAGSPFDVVVTATDDANATATQAFTWTVSNTNQAPATVGTIADRSDAEGAAVSQATAANFSDADAGDTLAYSAAGLPTGLAIDPASGVISGTLAFTASTASPFNVVVTATDGSNATATQAFVWTVTNTNRAPAVTNEPYAFTVTDNATVGAAVGAVSAGDADGDALSFSITGGNTGNAFAIDPASGAITVATSGVLVGGSQVTLTVRVADAGGLDDTTTVVITVQSSGPVDPFIFRNGFEGN
jgi:VCBS repeat-containing protein